MDGETGADGETQGDSDGVDVAKMKGGPITVSDLTTFLDTHSDFGFEIRVLNLLVRRDFTCEHGGTYDDPVTSKPREFDIRATRRFGKRFIRLAVECKNVGEQCPLLLSCLPRRTDESFHEVVFSVNPETHPFDTAPEPPFSDATRQQSRTARLTGAGSIYAPSDPVGKSCEQVGRSSAGELTANDSGIYEKWSQALSSAHDLTWLGCRDGSERTGDFAMSLVVPVVVVPDDRLWIVHFDGNGTRVSGPQQAARCSYFVGRSYSHRSINAGDEVTLSHLEFVTFSGLTSLVDSLCGSEQQLEKTFPGDQIAALISEQ